MTKERALELFRYVDNAVIKYGEYANEPGVRNDTIDELYRIYTILWEIINDIVKEKKNDCY